MILNPCWNKKRFTWGCSPQSVKTPWRWTTKTRLPLRYWTDLFNQDQLEKAEQHFCIALESAPNAVIVWLNLGRLLKNKGQDTAARQALLKCIEFDPDLPSAYQHLAVLEKANGNYDLVGTYLLKAKSILQSYQVKHNSPLPVKSRPDLAFVNFHLEEIYLHQQRVKDVITAYCYSAETRQSTTLSRIS